MSPSPPPEPSPVSLLAEDRCPGVLRYVEAADGLLARIRLPGGRLSSDQLDTLAETTDDLGDGRLELTSRGNVQIRGMSASGAAELPGRVAVTGLLPTPSRDRIRNVLASPLAGVDTGLDLEPFVRALDESLRSEPGLDDLSGRFLFGLDDGRRDIAALRPDVLREVSAEDAPRAVAADMIEQARSFLATAAGAWRKPESERSYPVRAAAATPPLGYVERADGRRAVVVAPPLGSLTSQQARWLAAHCADVRVTPWRSIVVPYAPLADPLAAGFVVDPGSPWRLVSACAGRPRCAKARADVRADATEQLGRHPGRRLHWAGCDRACGRTSDVEVTMIATGSGYVEERRA